MAEILEYGQSNSNAEEAQRVRRECEDAIKSHNNDLQRAYEVWDAYISIQGSQWDKKKRNQLKEEERHAYQFDILSAKVDTLAGSLIAEMPDIDWAPIRGQKSNATEAIREKYFIDKELFNYDDIILKTIRNGCVHSGWCQMTESDKYSPTKDIALEVCRPGYVIPDPYWKTDDDRDLECLYKIAYLKPDIMASMYPESTDKIKAAVQEYKKRKQIPQSTESIDDQQKQFKEDIQDAYRVIEYHYIERIKKERLLGAKFDDATQTYRYLPFPISQDTQLLQQFAQANEIDWQDVNVYKYEDRIHMVKTVTDLDPTILLVKDKSLVQVNGLPFFHFTCNRYNGHDKGIAESILDIQRVINEKESLLLEFIAKASGGSSVWNEDLFKNEDQKKRFVKNRNKPGHIEFADLDGVQKTHEDVNPASVPAAIFNEINRMYEQTLPIVSRVSDAMSAVPATGESGVLFERKYQMNRVANILYDKNVKQFLNNIGEAYYYQFQITYADIPLEIKSRKGSTIDLNKKSEINGVPFMINSVADMPRCKVVVTESTKTPIFQLRKRMEISEIIKNIPPNDYLRLQEALAIYFSNTPMNDEDKARMEVINEMERMRAQMQFVSEMAALDMQTKQSVSQAQQIEQMMGQFQGAQMKGANQPPIEDQVTPETQAPNSQAVEQSQVSGEQTPTQGGSNPQGAAQ